MAIAEKISQNTYLVSCPLYGLKIERHLVSVLSEGLSMAVLDIRSAVPRTLEDDSGAAPDAEPNIPVLTDVSLDDDTAVFVWKNKSSLWEKSYTLTCDRLRWHYAVTVKGQGRVDAVQYFSGDTSSKNHGSAYEFSRGFIPATNMKNLYNYGFSAAENFHGYSEELVPPMFCYAFKAEGSTRQLGLGLVAKRGEHNFHSFDYCVVKKGRPYPWTGFWLQTDQAGHVSVDGTWEAPAIYGFFGDDPWEIMQQYTAVYRTLGIARPLKERVFPRFWHGPILCGYIQQLIKQHEKGIHWMKLANAEFYEELLQDAKHLGLEPKMLIIDDKWQTDYACDVADPEKFPDMRSFIDKRHRDGLHTLLWFKLWDAEGADPNWCTPTDQEDVVRIDPSNPEYLRMLDGSLHRLLSSDEGCYDADGMKIDFAFFNPMGRKVRTHSGKYGAELLYDYLAYIYNRSKAEKPYALMNCSPCHPYFSDVCDMARIHDYFPMNRNNREELTLRAKAYATALPEALIDTDNAGFGSRRDSMRWLLHQSHVGVPALYAVTATCGMTEEDFRAVAQAWREYNARVDALYG